jgi:hypothetical protein
VEFDLRRDCLPSLRVGLCEFALCRPTRFRGSSSELVEFDRGPSSPIASESVKSALSRVFAESIFPPAPVLPLV